MRTDTFIIILGFLIPFALVFGFSNLYGVEASLFLSALMAIFFALGYGFFRYFISDIKSSDKLAFAFVIMYIMGYLIGGTIIVIPTLYL